MRIPTGLAVLLVVAFAVRIGFVLVHERPLRSDEVDFDRLAWNLARTGSYAEAGIPTAYRPVGYPAFLAAIYRLAGHHPFAVRVVQALLDTGTALLLFGVAARRRRAAAWLAASVWALYPPAILYTGFLVPETLFTFLLFAFLALFDLGADRRGWGGRVPRRAPRRPHSDPARGGRVPGPPAHAVGVLAAELATPGTPRLRGGPRPGALDRSEHAVRGCAGAHDQPRPESADRQPPRGDRRLRTRSSSGNAPTARPRTGGACCFAGRRDPLHCPRPRRLSVARPS